MKILLIVFIKGGLQLTLYMLEYVVTYEPVHIVAFSLPSESW